MNRFRSLPRGAPAWVVFKRALAAENAKWPKELKAVPPSAWPPATPENTPSGTRHVALWRSKDFIVQVVDDQGHTRLTINRTDVDINGRWLDGITWDELRRLKAEAGFADWWAVEVFPPEADIQNFANMRHLWLLPEPPPYGWKRGSSG